MYHLLFIIFKPMDKIILASQSPRRKQLLEQAELAFDIIVADIEETYPSDMPAALVPEYLARKKAKAVAKNNDIDGAIIIAADTVVILNNQILGKPIDKEDAFTTLKKLSGKTHTVVSGVCIQKGDQVASFSSTTEVTFRKLTSEQIEHYIDKYEPYDKAGAYAIQEWIGVVGIKKIKGDYYNVVGLPVGKVIKTLYGRFIAE